MDAEDVFKELGIHHCPSCHEDWDEGYNEPDLIEFNYKGITYRTWDSCCGVTGDLQDGGIAYEYV